MESIGIVDFDFLSTKKLCNYNFGVLLVSSYYLKQGLKIRLILELSHENLMKYDKIYMFKDYKTKIKPINLIKDYYSLPVEEYGEGFDNRPLLPNLPDLIYTPIKTDIYKPILFYINNGGKKFQTDKNWNEKYYPTKIFFMSDGELLLREEPKGKRLLVYDDPDLFFTTELGRQKMTEMLKKSIIKFVKPLRIGIIQPSEWNQLFKTTKIVGFKDRLYAYEGDPYLQEFIQWCQNNDVGQKITIAIKTDNKIMWFKKRGGKIYGNYGNNQSKRNDKERIRNSTSEENLSIRYEWFTAKRPIKNNRLSREGISKKEGRKYLPSEYAKRDLERRKNRNYKRGW